MARNIALFIALVATAIALGGALAHAFALPNRIGMPASDYFISQQAYRGWSLLALVILVQFAGILWSLVLYWKKPAVKRPVLVALGCLVATQAIFWIYTYPANAATANWTEIPDNWQQLRRHWEYSHAAGALFQLLAMIALTVAVLSRKRES